MTGPPSAGPASRKRFLGLSCELLEDCDVNGPDLNLTEKELQIRTETVRNLLCLVLPNSSHSLVLHVSSPSPSPGPVRFTRSQSSTS